MTYAGEGPIGFRTSPAEVEPVGERPAIAIEQVFHLRGRVLTKDGKAAGGLTVTVMDYDRSGGDDFLGTVKTSADGGFDLVFKNEQFQERYYDRKPDLYFEISNGRETLLSTKDNPLMNLTEASPPITLTLP